MALTDKKAPELRFKGFSQDWELCKVKNVLDVNSGRDYKHLDKGTIPVYGTGGYMLSVDQALSYNQDAIGIGRKGTIDKPYILVAPFWTVDTLFYCIPKENLNLIFLFGMFQKIKWKSMDESTGVPSLSKTAINNIIICKPSLKEQEKIGKFLLLLENTITLHQRKLDQLKDLKQAYLQQLFPSDGEYAPKVRFSNFNLNWEQRKLGEIAPLRGGFAFKSSEFQEEGIPIVRISNILATGEVGGDFIYYPEQVKDDNYLLPDRSAVLAMSGATTGKVSILSNPNDGKVYQNQRVGYFTKTEIADYGFISTITRSQMFIEQLGAMLVAGAQPNISSKDIDMMNFTVPTNLEEQTKIGVFFEEFDHLITLHQQKLSKLERLKSAYLQKMFI